MGKPLNKYELDFFSNDLYWIETFYNIKSKERKIVPFIPNPIQVDYMQNRSFRNMPGRGARDLVLKARQHGFTSIKLAEMLTDCMTDEGVISAVVGHDDKAMKVALDNVRMMYRSIPIEFRPSLKYNSKEEMFFPELNSRFIITTYRKQNIVSQTINNLLMTETASWKARNIGDMIADITEAVPKDGNICFESTPKGLGGHFWEMCRDAKAGNSIYKLFIYPWFINNTYFIPKSEWIHLNKKILPTGIFFDYDKLEERLKRKYNISDEQLMWRRYKMMSLGGMRINNKGIRISRRFGEQYECSFLQSGSTVFDATYLIPSTYYQEPEKAGRYIHGGDTAEGVEGGNYNVFYTINLDTGEIVNKIRGLWKPDEFAQRIHRILMKYGGLAGIEVNNTGHAVLLKLALLQEQETIDLEDKAIQAAEKSKDQKRIEAEYDVDKYDRIPYRIFSEKKRLGWNTNTINRKIMFIEGEEALRHEEIKLAEEDEEGLEELIAVQYNDKMKEEAPEGMFDDSVMALLIGNQMRKYYQFYFRDKNESGVIVS